MVLPFNSFNKGAWSWDQDKFLKNHAEKDLDHGKMSVVYGMTMSQYFSNPDWPKHYAYDKRIAKIVFAHMYRN